MLRQVKIGISAKSLGYDYLSLVESYANQLELKGVLFTKDDGSIKIIAEGEEKDLEEFIEKIKEEEENLDFPIENFYANWSDPTGEFKDFSITNNNK